VQIHSSLQYETQVVFRVTGFDDRMAEPARAPIGDPLLERLERLAARQGRAPAGGTLPPPVAGPAEVLPSSPSHGMAPGPPRTPRRRRHPARGARIGALVASCATTGGLAYFFAGTDASQTSSAISGLVAPIATTEATSTAAPTTAATDAAPATTAVTSATTAPVAAPTANSVVAFDGDTIQSKYGPVQVQAQIQDGSLVAVAIVQYPDDDGKSVRINQRALPELQSEALTAQSAQVDTVSGATYTSNAYVESLQSAIDDARAAGAMTA